MGRMGTYRQTERPLGATVKRPKRSSGGKLALVLACCALAFVVGLAPVAVHLLVTPSVPATRFHFNATVAPVTCPASAGQCVYTSEEYHFKVRYPANWVVNTAPDASAIVPLTILITQANSHQTSTSMVSTFTVAVFAMANAAIAQNAASLPTNKTLRAVRIADRTAYAAAPVKQPVPGTAATDTHQEYTLVAGAYEYQISTDAISTTNVSAALQGMLRSFTVLP